MTVKEALRDARSLVRKKIRQANAADQKAYKKAYNLKGVRKSGNTRSRSKRQESAAQAVDGSVQEIGRDAGVLGA